MTITIPLFSYGKQEEVVYKHFYDIKPILEKD
jgi:hypothetical protein